MLGRNFRLCGDLQQAIESHGIAIANDVIHLLFVIRDNDVFSSCKANGKGKIGTLEPIGGSATKLKMLALFYLHKGASAM